MLASFSVIPVGTGEELSDLISELVPVIETSGLPFRLGAMQTTVEGDPSAVMDVIMECHAHMKSRASRVLTSITIDDRAGATNRLTGKVADVEHHLGRRVPHE